VSRYCPTVVGLNGRRSKRSGRRIAEAHPILGPGNVAALALPDVNFAISRGTRVLATSAGFNSLPGTDLTGEALGKRSN